MVSKEKKKLFFLIVFLVLTVLCWCPIGYGNYGEVSLIMGMPSWAFILLVIGSVLFVFEWIYLFFTDLALYDEDLEEIMAELMDIQTDEVIVEEN